MASSDATQRAVLAGLSCGIGLAAPVVMYAATLPFSSVNETVVAGAVPFAVGAVAGVGIYAASLGISEYRAEHDGRLFEPDAVGGAAQFGRTHNEFKTASIPAQQQGATPQPAAPADQANAAQPSSAFLSGLTGAFQRRHIDDDVPTIARAANAMDEAEAWSMIDSMLDDDSPVSCDPARSRDVYQVAIDELTNGGKTGSYNRDDIAAAARAVSGSHAAPAGSTAAFVALVANAANNAAYNGASSAAYTSAAAAASAGQQSAAQPAPAADPFADEPLAVDEETIAARRGKGRTLRSGVSKKEKVQYAEMLKELDLGLDTRLTSKVGLLSGGQRQAVTLLMATLKKPKVLLLDEHTAALDPKTAKKVLDLTEKIVARDHLTTIMITHNMKDAIAIGNRLIMMNEGKIIYDVSGEEKKKLTTKDLLDKFKVTSGEEFDNDRVLLSTEAGE